MKQINRSPFSKVALVFVRFNHVASVIKNANHSGVRSPPTRYSGLIIFFCVDGVEILGLRFFGGDCEHSPVGEKRCGEAVIEVGRAECGPR